MHKPQLTLRLRILMMLERWSLPLLRWRLRRRLATGKESLYSMEQKLMRNFPVKESHFLHGGKVIWGHAVGVGEVLALLGLFRRLSTKFPEFHFLLTSSSRTSGEALQRQVLDPNFHHQYAPIDHPEIIREFLAYWRPSLACWSETDLWPQMIMTVRDQNIPMYLFNARMTKEKLKARLRFFWFYQPLLSVFTRIYAQNSQSAILLQELGAPPRIFASLTGNIKAIAPPPLIPSEILAVTKKQFANRPIWLLASSFEGEEAIALEVHRQLLRNFSDALLILVPRDISRSKDIFDLAKSKSMVANQRTVNLLPDNRHSVFIADTMGELGLWYQACPVALVGGSFVSVGGKNPYEAVSSGCFVLTGPDIHNLSEEYEELFKQGLAKKVKNENEIAHEVSAIWRKNTAGASYAPSTTSTELLEMIIDDIRATLNCY